MAISLPCKTHWAQAYGQRLPIFLWLLVGYLATDALFRLMFLGAEVASREEFRWQITREQGWSLLLGVFYLLLAGQLLLRSFAARISICVIFAIQIGLFVANFVVLHPEKWWSFGTAIRLQLLAQVIFYSISIVLINRSPAREVLRL